MSTFPAPDLEKALRALNPNRILEPNTSIFQDLYVPRPDMDRSVITPMVNFFIQAAQDRTHGQWFLTGHTGCGKGGILFIQRSSK
ncbi:MAG: hypothetical protein HQL93_02310 [Magnetococcales bacterium]|nr:hypothetical protein [Magnetococcales bacterium]